MINGHFVIDAVTHPYLLGPGNVLPETSPWRRVKGLYRHHKQFTPHPFDEHFLEEHEMFSDFPLDGYTSALFAESDTDYAVIHTLPNLGFNYDRLVPPERAAAVRDANPNRFLPYANVTPTETDHSLRELEHQVSTFGFQGLKLYPVAPHGRGNHIAWFMDDPKITYPVFEKCLELGINNVAIHKLLTLGASPLNAFHVGDIEGAARDFPQINFQVVHAGYAFLDETLKLMERYDNVYANLEGVFALILNYPRMFAEIMGSFLYYGLGDKLLYSSGCNAAHPQPPLAAFADFQMPQDILEKYGTEEAQFTDELKGKILGGNFAQLHGLDIDELKAGIEGDTFEKRKADGLERPWGTLRKILKAEGIDGSAPVADFPGDP